MAIERTLSIIKPDAVAKNLIGQITARFETAGLKIVAARMVWLKRRDAEGFYAVHKGRPFFDALVDFMVSGPVMIQALEGENAIAKNRELMGATDPKKARAGSIRADFADSIDANAVHGSDAADTARAEIAFFFPKLKARKEPKIGPSRPQDPTSNTGRVWVIADAISKEQGRPALRAEVLRRGEAAGLKHATVTAQFQLWRGYHGLTGRQIPPKVKPAKKEPAPAAKPSKPAKSRANRR